MAIPNLTIDDFLGQQKPRLTADDFGIVEGPSPEELEQYEGPNGIISIAAAHPEKMDVLKNAGVKNFVPLGVKDTPYRRELLRNSNKARLNLAIDSRIAENQGIEVPETKPDETTLEKIFRALDYPGSKVRQFITGIPSEEGNSFTKYLNEKLDVPDYEEPLELKASHERNDPVNPLSISGFSKPTIPGTNVSSDFIRQFDRTSKMVSDPAWQQHAATAVSGTALDILSDPLTWLGPGAFTKASEDAPRRLLSLTTPELSFAKPKNIPLTPAALDAKVMSGLDKVGTAIGNTRVGRVLGKAFIPGFGLPKDYYNMHQDALDKMNFDIQNLYTKADQAFGNLSDDELKFVSHYVEGNANISSIPADRQQAIIDAADQYKQMRDDLAQKLVQSRILKQTPTNDQYVPHIYDDTEKPWIRSGPMGSIKEETPFFAKQRTYNTIQEAQAQGKFPKEDIDEITKFYGAGALTEINKREFINNAVQNFGTKVNGVAHAQRLLKQSGDGFAMYAPKGTFSLHNEKYVPKSVLRNQGNLISISIDDLKDGAMFSRNVPVYIMPKNIADDLNRAEKVFGNEESTKGFLKFYDNLLRMWKGRVTVTSPGFHARNFYSNIGNAYLGGLEDVSRFKKAAEIANGAQGTFAGRSYEDILTAARRYGVYSPTAGNWMKEIYGPEIIKKASTQELVNPFSQRFGAVEGGRRVGAAIENNARLALFIDRLSKGDTPINASMHVKKYLFDYSELTPFERNIMKRTIPFYTWMRKNIPVQVEGLVNNPKVASTVGKVTQHRYGEEDELSADQLPMGMSPTGTVVLQGGKAPVVANLDLPISDLAGEKGIGLSPVFKVASDIYDIYHNNKPPADRTAPELVNVIYQQLPEQVRSAIDADMVKSKYTKEQALAMDPRITDILQQVAPLFMRVSKLIPTDNNLADPGYQKRLSGFVTGVPISVVDLKEQEALRRLTTKAILENSIKNAEKEGKVNPAAINILRNYFKLQ